MITNWTIENFKSAGERTQLEFAPITIFAGANNSGKSTVIHSILMTAQTIQSRVEDRAIILNGHMVRLGDYSDVVFGAEKGREICVGFEIKVRGDRRPLQKSGRSIRHFHQSPQAPDEARVSCEYRFGGVEQPDRKRLTPELRAVNIDVESENSSDFGAQLKVVRAPDTPDTRLSRYSIDAAAQTEQVLESLLFSVESIRPTEPLTFGRTYAGLNYLGTHLRHFLPNRLTVVYNRSRTRLTSVLNAVASQRSREWYSAESDIQDALDCEAFRVIIVGLLHAVTDKLKNREAEGVEKRMLARRIERLTEGIAELDADPSVETFRSIIRSLPTGLRGEFAEEVEEHRSDLVEALRASSDRKYGLTTLSLSPQFAPATSGIHAHFQHFLRYLGPLRDEPKSVYPLAGSTDPQDVGLRGEHTAAVLDMNRHEVVQHVKPPELEEGLINASRTEEKLEDAVKSWLEYMGVGEDLRTVDRGKLGHELNIATGEGAELHDLSQVGVGVSQVLPILVSALLADAGSTLIYEQPELHLHPRVQARLADFFVAMSQLDKQCVIETHSEYMINRLRYQIAKSHGEMLSEDVTIYFTEKSGSTSHYRRVTVDRYGAIENWPKGFFDQGERMAASILEARMEKQKEERE